MVRNLEELGVQLQNIFNRLLANQKLLKLLYYNDKDPYSHPDLTETQIHDEVCEKLIKFIPRIGPKETANSVVSIRVVQGAVNEENNQFVQIQIGIEVLVPLTQWAIKNTNLRPFAILGQIQQSLNGKIVDGLGRLMCGDFSLSFLTEEMSCYNMDIFVTDYD